MSEFAIQVAVALGVVSTIVVGPGIAAAFLLLRRRRRRAQRRSPIGIDLLRGPGHSLREQLEELSQDLMSRVYMLSAMPPLVLAIFLAQAHSNGLQRMSHLIPVYAGFTLLFVAFAIWKMVKSGEKLDRLRTGYDAELAVGQELDQLMRQGAVVFHDFPGEQFNIDHVVIAREGLFAVETKGYTKSAERSGRAGARVVYDGQALKFPQWTTSKPIEQAQRQAQWLSAWAESVLGTKGVVAMPVVVLPGWFVELAGRGAVRVFNGKQLAGLLQSRGAKPMTEQDVQRLAHQVEQRCRTVEPTYGPN